MWIIQDAIDWMIDLSRVYFFPWQDEMSEKIPIDALHAYNIESQWVLIDTIPLVWLKDGKKASTT